jgi:DNA-binding NtrC family response regulator
MRPDRVLIVDDDGSTRRGLVQLLVQAGYDATAVGTFEEARRIISVTPPDLLITDIRLEEYNGLQLILNSPRTIPTIVITGFADPVLEAEARRGGAAYMVKPVQPLQLLEVVAEKLAARHSHPGIQ